MANKQTEYRKQNLLNLGADFSVSPPIARKAGMGKDSGGNWRVIKVTAAGNLIINTS